MPVRFRYEFKRVEIAPEMARAEYTAAANEWWDQAILAFVEASQAVTAVDTGMSASSFAALADHVEPGSGRLIYGSESNEPLVMMGGTKYPDHKKTPEAGYALGRHAFEILYMSATHSVMRFEYLYKVYQLALWTEARNDAWGVKAAGNAAFSDALKQGAHTVRQGFQRAIRGAIRTKAI